MKGLQDSGGQTEDRDRRHFISRVNKREKPIAGIQAVRSINEQTSRLAARSAFNKRGEKTVIYSVTLNIEMAVLTV